MARLFFKSKGTMLDSTKEIFTKNPKAALEIALETISSLISASDETTGLTERQAAALLVTYKLAQNHILFKEQQKKPP